MAWGSDGDRESNDSSGDGEMRLPARPPIDPITRARATEPLERAIEEVPTDASGSIRAVGPETLEDILGDPNRTRGDQPFDDEPTRDADAPPDEPTWRDPADPAPDPATGGAPPRGVSGADGSTDLGPISVRVPTRPVRERRRLTGPVELRVGDANEDNFEAGLVTPGQPPPRARRRRPTSYQGVAAKPSTRRHPSWRRVVGGCLAVLLLVAALVLLARVY